MEELQDALQSILSDPDQMARVAALAESLGLKPPGGEAEGVRQQAIGETSGSTSGSVFGRPTEPPLRGDAPQNCHSERSGESVPPFPFSGSDGVDLGQVMGLLSASSGGEARVLTTLRPALGPENRSRVDRALRAAKLSRLVSTLLTQRRQEHV